MSDFIKQILAALSGLFKSQQSVFSEAKKTKQLPEKDKLMGKTVLRIGDGINADRKTEDIINDVKALQRYLGITPDGKFGKITEAEVKHFQSENGLTPDGVVGSMTWKRLTSNPGKRLAAIDAQPSTTTLNAFRGDLKWVHAREGHAGRAYWAGGASGVTLDPGFDLGYADRELFDTAYSDILSEKEMEACRKVLGLKSYKAKAALADGSPTLKAIRITRKEADKVFPIVAAPYWDDITKRFPVLLEDDCPGEVQTAMLSIAFNRGPGNKGLNVLNEAMSNKDWDAVGEIIRTMQQDHKLEGIRKRRRMEGDLILNRDRTT